MAYLYRHVRLDNNEVFYIGIGSDKTYKRATSFYNRSKYWYNITKNIKYRVDILFNDLSWEEVCRKEIRLIKLYGRKDLGLGTLVNFTDGGDGHLGGVYTEALRLQMSLSAKERYKKNPHCRKGKTFINKNSRKVVIFDLKTYIISKFDSIIKASIFIKRHPRQVRNACIQSKNNIKRSVNDYFVRFGESISDEDISYLKLNYNKLLDIQIWPPRKKNLSSKKVIDIITGEIFPSISSVSLKYSMPVNTTSRWIKTGKLNLKFL